MLICLWLKSVTGNWQKFIIQISTQVHLMQQIILRSLPKAMICYLDPELKPIYDEALKQYYGSPKHLNSPANKWQVAQEKVKKHLALKRSQFISEL